MPTSFPGVTADSEARAVADIAWRDYFADPRLRELIELALANNRDLRISTLNIEQARAQYRIQRADRFPAINAGIGETTTRTPGDLTSSGNATISRQYSANLGLSAWELDFFGRVRSLSEQALETYLGTEEARRSAQLSLVAEVATAWLTLAADRELRDLAQNTFETQQKSLSLTRKSFEAGASSALDLRQAETTMQRARADAALYTAQVARTRTPSPCWQARQCPPRCCPKSWSTRSARWPNFQPGAVLGTRAPTRRAAGGAPAARGQCQHRRRPRGLLPAHHAHRQRRHRELDARRPVRLGFAQLELQPQLSLPIFNAGALRASLDVAEVQRDINVATYEKTIQSAFREVADGLADRATLAEQLDAERRLVAASERPSGSPKRATATVSTAISACSMPSARSIRRSRS